MHSDTKSIKWFAGQWDEYKKLWRTRKLLAFVIAVIVVLLVVSPIMTVIGQFFWIPSLERDIDNLENEVAKKSTTITELRGSLIMYQHTALEKFPNMSSAEAMGELAKVLASVKDTTKILFDYQEVAKWSIRGQSLQASGGGGYVTMTSPVAGWFEGYVVFNQNNEIVKKDCSEEGVNHYIEMTQRFKSYPFPYYVLAECEKELNRPEWQTNMNTAYEILAKTSTYLLRSPDHDRYFAKITEFKGFEIDTILNGTPR